jgi:Protein of unknown function (DUF1656)
VSSPKEIDVLGVFMAPFAAYLAIAVILFLAMDFALRRAPVERWVWNRPLAELAVFIILVAGVMFAAIGP